MADTLAEVHAMLPRDPVEQGLDKPAEGLRRLKDINLDTVGRHNLTGAQDTLLAHATVAGIGVVAGRIAVDPAAAKRAAGDGDPPSSCVVARQLGRVCLVGCTSLAIDAQARTCRIGSHAFNEGDWLTLDGKTALFTPAISPPSANARIVH